MNLSHEIDIILIFLRFVFIFLPSKEDLVHLGFFTTVFSLFFPQSNNVITSKFSDIHQSFKTLFVPSERKDVLQRLTLATHQLQEPILRHTACPWKTIKQKGLS